MRRVKLVDVGTNYILYLTDDRGKDTAVIMTKNDLKEVYNEIRREIKCLD